MSCGSPGCHGIPRARKLVVEELWNLGVGEGQGYPTNKDSELEYLRSCRNARRLREIVLDELIDVGEQRVGGHHGDKARAGATCKAD